MKGFKDKTSCRVFPFVSIYNMTKHTHWMWEDSQVTKLLSSKEKVAEKELVWGRSQWVSFGYYWYVQTLQVAAEVHPG